MLKEYRKLYTNLTQEDMAELLNISRRTYQTIEKKNDCQLKTAIEISKIFNNNIYKIFFD